jgi:hypothetical protein
VRIGEALQAVEQVGEGQPGLLGVRGGRRLNHALLGARAPQPLPPDAELVLQLDDALGLLIA